MLQAILPTFRWTQIATAGFFIPLFLSGFAAICISIIMLRGGIFGKVHAWMQDVNDLSLYHAVIVGSPIHTSRWLPGAMQFLQTYRAELAHKRVATFTVCITMAMPNAEHYQDTVREWMAPVRAMAQPVSEGLFAVHVWAQGPRPLLLY